MRIAIMGSGGVGGYLGARLAASGRRSPFWRAARISRPSASTVSRSEARSATSDPPGKGGDDPAAVASVDVVIFAVKLYDTEAAAAAAADRARNRVLTLQNGVDSTETLARVLGAACVIEGVAQIASVIAEAGRDPPHRHHG